MTITRPENEDGWEAGVARVIHENTPHKADAEQAVIEAAKAWRPEYLNACGCHKCRTLAAAVDALTPAPEPEPTDHRSARTDYPYVGVYREQWNAMCDEIDAIRERIRDDERAKFKPRTPAPEPWVPHPWAGTDTPAPEPETTVGDALRDTGDYHTADYSDVRDICEALGISPETPLSRLVVLQDGEMVVRFSQSGETPDMDLASGVGVIIVKSYTQ